MLFYRAALPLSRQTLCYVAGVIRRHLTKIGSAWRRLNPALQTLLLMTYMRRGDTYTYLYFRFGVSTTAVWRSVEETVKLLSACAATLRAALRRAAAYVHAYLILDGTLLPFVRVAS